ncbi:MAG: sigma-70 family RNA polymerase sigma factor [Deltaproteobacteria bacterium]|nr:sigma-70 family RNA polymerase sigma factor [Deltaproteobacteria bacterium]MBI2211817.1 sigma-70 family RNA polymerase sigma factor [Deltaproteobacteria bacterium]MBI2349827.1 sigma-70 family RNA polymerase sigma factor [Deltaproteobacteria bacterium]MBI2538785.1 sigma-70 family RNA polymerase sigma factor [Deltaproteobacteria bacterium]
MSAAEEITALIPRLRRYARALTGDRSFADDLVQDTLERAWGRIYLWRPGSDLRAWLFTIMHNLHVNQARTRRSEDSIDLRNEPMEFAARPSQEERLEIRDLTMALRRLPDEQREVLLLVGLEEMSYQEAAKVLAVPLGTVMSRLSRGRERLRALMSEGGNAPQLRVVK